MISRIKVVLVVAAVALLICNPAISVTHAQQAQTETEAVQLVGLVGLKDNTKGRLRVVNGTLRFIYAKGNVEVGAASIQDVLTGKDSQRVVGGTLGTVASIAGPYGSGTVLSLFRKKLDSLTIQYRDADGGLHGAIFTMPVGKAEMIKKELIAQGAHTTIPTQSDPKKTSSGSREDKQ
jgi:hypothetical protein